VPDFIFLQIENAGDGSTTQKMVPTTGKIIATTQKWFLPPEKS